MNLKIKAKYIHQPKVLLIMYQHLMILMHLMEIQHLQKLKLKQQAQTSLHLFRTFLFSFFLKNLCIAT